MPTKPCSCLSPTPSFLSLTLMLSILALAAVGCADDVAPPPAVTALRGTAHDATGAPLAGVTITTDGATAVSGADGRYQLDALAGSHVVRFSKVGYVDVIARLYVVVDSPTQRDATMLAMAPAMPLDSSVGDAGGAIPPSGRMAASPRTPPSPAPSSSPEQPIVPTARRTRAAPRARDPTCRCSHSSHLSARG